MVNGQPVVKSSLQSTVREKGVQIERESEKRREKESEEEGGGGGAISAKVNRPEVTFEEKSEAQVEGNRWRRANHVKWECTSDGVVTGRQTRGGRKG